MATDNRESFKTLHKGPISATSIEQARQAARVLRTKLLVDATPEEVAQYNHRFGTHYKYVR